MLQFYLKCNAEVSVSERADQMALIPLQFKESPEIPSPLCQGQKLICFLFMEKKTNSLKS